MRVEVRLPPGLSHVVERLAAERGRPVDELLVELVHAGVESALASAGNGRKAVSRVDGPFVSLADRESLCRAMAERHACDPDGAPAPPAGCFRPRGR